MRFESKEPARPQLPTLDQRGRAGMQFLGSLQVFSSGPLLEQARDEFSEHPEAAKLAEEFSQEGDQEAWQQRVEKAKTIADDCTAYRFNRFYQRYVAEENWVRSLTAVERKRDIFSAALPAAEPESTERLILNPDLETPEYFKGVEWHLQPGGWDGYDLTAPMFISGIFPYVFSRGGYAAVAVGDDIMAQRRTVLEQLRHEPRRVYDVGCGGAGTLSILRSMYPEAELTGGDLSARLLTDGHRMSERMGWNITFRQEDGRHVGLDDNSVDTVISYAVHHEMPQGVTRDVLKEMFRILEPGGEMLISDPPPFRAVPPMQAAILDWETEYRAEPYFTEAGLLNLAETMRETGFVDVKEYALQETGYPWVTLGRKPN